jgi:hypothetical protein
MILHIGIVSRLQPHPIPSYPQYNNAQLAALCSTACASLACSGCVCTVQRVLLVPVWGRWQA